MRTTANNNQKPPTKSWQCFVLSSVACLGGTLVRLRVLGAHYLHVAISALALFALMRLRATCALQSEQHVLHALGKEGRSGTRHSARGVASRRTAAHSDGRGAHGDCQVREGERGRAPTRDAARPRGLPPLPLRARVIASARRCPREARARPRRGSTPPAGATARSRG